MESIHCLSCRNYLYDDKCEAFDHIPAAVLLGQNDHTKPIEGDHGILYNPLTVK